MPLFQQSVQKKFIAELDKVKVENAYQKLITHFGNPTIQENIRNAKEEQYQEGFLRELFVDVLGYVLNPQPNFNLITEQKNEKNSKKADGAILKDKKPIAVIELKSVKTTDLQSIEIQAFSYKNNQSDCVYVVTSNFQKIRFYIENAIDFEEFDLFDLSKERFALLYLCLHADSVLADTPLRVKKLSVEKEENITNSFYKEYSEFKRVLFEDIVKHNKHIDKFLLYKKTQKLLDRFLFIFFAEDKGLLPPNTVVEITNDWEKLKDLDEYQPLYNRFKKYFGYLNFGHVAKNYTIFAYNGGLFAPDELLDGLKITDNLLYNRCRFLAHYDYDTDVDTNILGHIFEHSLNEMDEIAASSEGEKLDKNKTKRKKDGVFYTPRYITKYIVESTIGELCKKEKIALGLDNETLIKIDAKKEKKVYQQKIQQYRDWLLQLTILDPACGSGAFLNQALEFLIEEHRQIDSMTAMLFGDAMIFTDNITEILEHNIFGVDINEESVEIARLSLWLRTAKVGRKLNDLSGNIKCGNSLISDVTIAGDLAFDWKAAFPEVFKKGGFDVIIGNPPYLRVQGLRDNFEKEAKFYESHFKSATGRFDIYVLFLEQSYNLIKKQGKVSFILPHKFLISDFGQGIRKFFTDNSFVESILHFGSEMVFADATTYTCIINLSHSNSVVKYKQIKPNLIFDAFEYDLINYNTLSEDKWNLKTNQSDSIFEKIYSQPWTVKDVFENISQGVVSVGDDIFLIKGKIEEDMFVGFSDKISKNIIIEAALVKPVLKGEDVKKYKSIQASYYCFYPHSLNENGKTVPFEEEYFKTNFPLAYQYILPFKEELIEKKIRYKTNPKAWYSLHRSREISLFEQLKIITPEISLGTNMTLDYDNLYHNTKCYTLAKKTEIEEDYKFWLAILNSSLLWFFLQSTGYVLRGGFFTFKTKYLEPFPLPKLQSIEEQIPFIEKVDIILSLNKEFQKQDIRFIKFLQSNFPNIKVNTKIETWYNLTFIEFRKELEKQKITIAIKELMDYQELFDTNKDSIKDLQNKINQTEKAIDKLVYQLYGLTQEEIQIIDNQ